MIWLYIYDFEKKGTWTSFFAVLVDGYRLLFQSSSKTTRIVKLLLCRSFKLQRWFIIERRIISVVWNHDWRPSSTRSHAHTYSTSVKYIALIKFLDSYTSTRVKQNTNGISLILDWFNLFEIHDLWICMCKIWWENVLWHIGLLFKKTVDVHNFHLIHKWLYSCY